MNKKWEFYQVSTQHCLFNIQVTYLAEVCADGPVRWWSSTAPSGDLPAYYRGRRASLDTDLAGLSAEVDRDHQRSNMAELREDDRRAVIKEHFPL